MCNCTSLIFPYILIGDCQEIHSTTLQGILSRYAWSSTKNLEYITSGNEDICTITLNIN